MATQSNLIKHLPVSVFTLSVLALLILACSGIGAAAADSLVEKWFSPEASAAKKNPIAPTQESIAAGQKIYSKTCFLCHGKTGDADGPAVIELNIHPARLSNPQLDTESDGSLFWKITTGKKPMPAYGKRLSETDRWNLINYIRTIPKH
jgi:mono/diheme cytochrome c family protein